MTTAAEEGEEKNDFGMTFVVLALVLGVGTRVLQRKCNVKAPYAVLLLVIGFAIGVLDRYTYLGQLSASIEVWKTMQSRSLMVMFLPPLLFASASAVDFHVFRRIAGQAVLLAGPGVFLSTLMTAPIPMFLFPDSFDFTGGMLFGAMFAATDPVAVVALLQELGAPPTLSVLIEGESLLNDGIAFALFLLFLGQMTGSNDPSVGEMIAEILFMSFFGVLIGVLGGLLCTSTIGHIWNEPVLEITVTVLTAWGVFLLGDAIEASGVLAVVAFGLTFASQSASHLSSEVHHAMKEVWHMLEFIANTLVFVFSGIVCAESILTSEHFDTTHLLWLIFLYVALNIIRVVMVGFFYLPLLRLGYGFDWKRGLIVSWSGLRGAVGLVAAIEVSETASCVETEDETHAEACVPAEVKDLILFYMSGIVILTILVNGTSTQWLVRRLGITRRSQTAKKNFDASLQRMNEFITNAVTEARGDADLAGADWNVVWGYMPKLSSSSSASTESLGVVAPSTLLKRTLSSQGLFSSKTSKPKEVMAEIRFRYLSFVKASYRAQFEDGMCGSWPTLRTLNEAASYAQDQAREPLDEWEGFLAKRCVLHKRRCYEPRSHKSHAARAYDIAYSFIKAHEFADEHIACFAENLGVGHLIAVESAAMLAQAQATLTQIQTAYDDIASSIKTGMAISRTLRQAHEFASEMYHLAEIDERDFELLDHELSHRMLQVKRSLGYVKVRSASELFRALPLFHGVDDKIVKAVRHNAALRRFQYGDLMLERGARRPGHIYLIIRGQVSFTLKRERVDVLSTLERRASSRSLLHDARAAAPPPRRRRGSAIETSSALVKRLTGGDARKSPQTLVFDEFTLPRSPAAASESSVKSPAPTAECCTGYRLLHDADDGTANACEPKGGDLELDSGAAPQNVSTRDDENGHADGIAYSFGRGELVGELDVFAESSGVTEVRCESIVEAFEISQAWLLRYFEQQGPGSLLESNLARHAALVALESFFPTLRTAPESLRTWIIAKLQIVRPPTHTRFDPLPDQSGIAVLLRGALLATGDRMLSEALHGVAVFELPSLKQTYAQDTLLVILPGGATALLKSDADGDSNVNEPLQPQKRRRGSLGSEAISDTILRKYSLQRPASRSVQHPRPAARPSIPAPARWPSFQARDDELEADEEDLDDEEDVQGGAADTSASIRLDAII